VRIWAAVWLVAAVLGGCIEQSRVLVADIPPPPELTVTPVDNPGQWTRLRATDVLALARAQYGAGVGTDPVVRFLWLNGGRRGSPLPDAPVWIIVSDDLLMGPGFGKEPLPPRSGLTWTYLSPDGEFLGSSSMSDPRGVPSLPPP
jgi:hypothetical protein